MKVALDVSAVPAQVAGAGRYVVELATRLPGAGVATTLVTRRDDASRWAKWSPASRVTPLVPNARAARLLVEAWRLGTSEVARSADVWHAPHYTMPHRGSTPSVVTIHDLTFFTNPEWHERRKVEFFRRAIRYAAAHAAVLISVSEFTARQIDEVLTPHAPVIVAPHGVDLERFTPVAVDDAALINGLGAPASAPYVLFVGTLEPRKGLDVLLDAFGDVARRDSSLELWIAGQAGWGVPGFDEHLARHPSSSRIRRLGYVDDRVLPALMRRSRAVVYPSRGEGFGLPVLEAMACGAVVVTSSDTVMQEVAGEAALLAQVGDVASLASRIEAATAMEGDDRAAFAGRARARAEHFTWDVSLERHRSAYDLARKVSQ